MFKEVTVYRVSGLSSAAALGEEISKESFAPCLATQQKSAGWVPPRDEHGSLVESVGGHWIARFAIETKPVPGDAVRRKVQQAVAEIEKTSGRKPGKKELRDLRDDALLELLPQAFPRRAEVPVWIDPTAGLLVIGTAAQGKADEIVTSLVRSVGQGFAINLLQTKTSPQAALAAWLADDEGEALPDAFDIGRECELKGSGDEPAVVKFGRHPIETDEVRQHIAEGKLPTKVAMGWAGRVGFTLTQALQLKKITLADGVLEGRDKDEDRFDADVAISTGELRPLIADLIEALGGELSAAPGEESGAEA